MALAKFELAIVVTEMNCGECGGVYAINETYREQCHKYGKSWHCPYCQVGWGYSGKGELEQEKKRHQETLARLNEATAEKARLEQKMKRVGRGVCPDCNRTFRNLERHMACKHAAKK